MKLNLEAKLIFYEWFYMKSRFDTEAKGNLEMAY